MSKLILPFIGNGDSSQNEVPILPRFVSDSNVDRLADQNLEEKGRANQDKFVSSINTISSPDSQPAKKVKKDSYFTFQTVCELLSITTFFGVTYGVLFGFVFGVIIGVIFGVIILIEDYLFFRRIKS